MSLSRSPSPIPGGGWATPGLTINSSGRTSPAPAYAASSPVNWEPTSRSRGNANNGYPSFSTQNRGFFHRHMRNISNSLPRFSISAPNNPAYGEKEKLNRGRPSCLGRFYNKIPLVPRIIDAFWKSSRKFKARFFLAVLLFIGWIVFYNSPGIYYWRRNVGGGDKFVIILGANVGGGVMEWKGAREWAIERDSIRNKRKYVSRWGYNLEIIDMATKKKYAHEWRESWEKIDAIRNAFKKYPDAEWFWWLDLTTLVMEPSYSLQDHMFNNLDDVTYRDINYYNPLNITHPFPDDWLDPVSRSPVGDGKPSSVNLVLSQDCSGFNLGSFFIRRSTWSERLLDVWWDPVAYEQKHMEWAHKEQDALEALYTAQPWIRKHTAFVEQRKINSFPPGACSENGEDEKVHYNRDGGDFLMNMAGCEWGRDCWGEMYKYRELSYYLNRNPWERFKEDLVAVVWEKLTGQKVKL
ncbi:glycosyltransferase family 34 protein [Zalerion maritima]|uniref:Glycosyltransferase family 34 protein n=1 Tax=Zalerion maritima TaxID=339359 RepID=A0AAD5RF82_9PEZI|nr:glycosyltransferase family 34 protein [Zalerion maritima]